MTEKKPKDEKKPEDDGLSISEQIAATMLENFGIGTKTYNPPPRYYSPGGSSFPAVKYEGANLVDLSGNADTPKYDTSDEYAKYVYGTLTPSSRQLAFSVLKDKGFYGGGKIGDFSSDINAIQGWLDYSNTVGYTSDRALKHMLSSLPSSKSSTGNYRPRINVSSPDDLKAVAKKVSIDTLGRAFTDAEADKFVKAYQAQEIDYQKMGQQSRLKGGGDIAVGVPSADVAAQKFAQESAPTEAQGYQYLGYVNKFFNAIGKI